MLSGLGEMGKVKQGATNNAAGGEIRFEVELSGAEADLRSVLALVVPGDAIHIGRMDAEPAPAPLPASQAPAPGSTKSIVADDHGGEIFFDPAEWKKKQKAQAAEPAAVPAAPPPPDSGDSSFDDKKISGTSGKKFFWTTRQSRKTIKAATKAANILAPVELQCRWLREIGYEEVDGYFRIYELAVFGGRRPS